MFWSLAAVSKTNGLVINYLLHYTICRSGVGANLQYISEEDVKSEKVTVVPSAKREPSGSGMTGGPDAEDLAVLRRRRRISNSPKNSVGGSAMVVGDEQRLVALS